MNSNTLKLKHAVFSANSPSHALVVRYYKAIVAQARLLPASKRDDLRYEMFRPWLELDGFPDGDEQLEYIVGQLLGGELDVLDESSIEQLPPSDQPAKRAWKDRAWQELIERVEALP